MKLLKLAFGTLMALATVDLTFRVIEEQMKYDGVRGTTSLFAWIAAIAMFSVLTLTSFQSALRKPDADEGPNDEDSQM